MLQLTSERERFTARLQEEQERAEREQQAALAEAVKGQAQLRAELASTVQRVQVSRTLRCAYLVCLPQLAPTYRWRR
jgi:multidrug efflux pump subunit AcrA (membrane-fusion protein)